ncbi:unnamed protein product, partial [Mesorhabditis belari]|uniref:Uncharacterized protein n=1 Tax=Mesorhabditis belari TaxID=2138241 RepID=A0AAF3EHA1_9BILA
MGTYRYMSPEACGINGPIRVTEKSDLYAVGLVLWEIVERKLVFLKHHPDFPNQSSLDSPNCEEALANAIMRCTHFDSEQRPVAIDVLNSIENLKPSYTSLPFKPIQRDEQERIIRPIGFDKTNDEIPLEEEVTESSDLVVPSLGMEPLNNYNDLSPLLEAERNPSISSTIILITAIVVFLVIFVLLWALYHPSPCPAPSCQYGWNYFNGSCYKLYSKKVEYDAAEVECRANNANVVSIHSEQEQKFVNGLRKGSWTWLGLKYDSQWSWSDGSDVDYTNWEDGHPILTRSLANMRRDTGKWESKTSLDSNFFICKKPK